MDSQVNTFFLGSTPQYLNYLVENKWGSLLLPLM